MAVDPLAFIRAQRAGATGGEPVSDQIRLVPEEQAPARGNTRADPRAVPSRPGDPGYYERIPPGEPDGTAAQAAAPPAGFTTPPQPATVLPAPPPTRIAVYAGRGEDDFVVAVEIAPEWDTVKSWKLTGAETLRVLPILRALDVRISDKTGGEITALEMDHGS